MPEWNRKSLHWKKSFLTKNSGMTVVQTGNMLEIYKDLEVIGTLVEWFDGSNFRCKICMMIYGTH